MTPCTTPRCPNQTRPSPGALFCPDCQEQHLARIEGVRREPRTIAMLRNESALAAAPGYVDPWRDGTPNVTCPACQGRYHYGAPAPFTHLCPLCETWLCWEETGGTVARRRKVRKCPRCSSGVTKRGGKYGEFFGCDDYPRCKGIAKSFNVEEYEAPRLGLAVWKARAWDDGDDVDHFARLDRATQKRKGAIEARGRRWKRWWE